MELQGDAQLLRIFLGESDKIGHAPLHEIILREARSAGLAGGTVWRGISGFGASSRIRKAGILDLSADLPLIVEIADQAGKIEAFLPVLNALFEKARCGGLITLENVRIIRCLPKPPDTGAP